MQKRKPITKKMLSKIQIEQTRNGFTVWIVEKEGTRHWLIDGSTVLQDGVVFLGQTDCWKHSAVYEEDMNEIHIVRK